MALYNLSWSLEYYEEHTDECNAVLNSLDNFERVPLLEPSSFETLTDGALVRYRGMIQDMLNPEYYTKNFTIVNKVNNESYVRSGKYRDVASCKVNEEINLKDGDFVPCERLVFFCIPIPGVNDWVFDVQKPQITSEENKVHTSGVKRSGDDIGAAMDTETPQTTSQANTKRNVDDVEAPMDSETNQMTSPANTKRNKSSEDKDATSSQNDAHDNKKYFPLPTNYGLPCLIKVYEEEEKLGFVLNDNVEVLGFLSLNPAIQAECEDPDIEGNSYHPPPSLVPRVHALIIKKLQHCNPLLKQITFNGDPDQQIESIRSDLHLILTQLLFEDTLAADYLICNLISKIYIRDESNTIGMFSLNLFNIHFENFTKEFYNVIKTLVTNSHYVPLSTNLLNEKHFVPRMDYESNRLCSGMLQLSDDTHLILDETKMNEGQLNNTGCLNVSALQKVFRDQELQYDFGYYMVKYNTNIPLLVISEGKSMFEADVRVKVMSESFTEANLNESLQAVKLYLNNNDILNKIRVYLTSVRLRDFQLGEEMMKKIGEDYVSLRQKDREVNSSDLHILLILARLLALSRGRTALKPEDWARALEMEAERKSRLI